MRQGGFDKGFILISPRLIGLLRRLRPDVILVAEYTMATAYAVIAGRLLGVPVVVMQEHSARRLYRPGRLKRLYRRALVAGVDFFIANTQAAAAEVRTALGVEDRRIVEVSLLVPPERDDLTRRPVQLPVPNVRPLLLYVGQLVPGKNVRMLLDALHILVLADCPCSLWIVGEGPLRSELESLARERQLESRVEFLGSIPYESIGFAYQAADIFCMPTLSDYRSVSVLEAMRFGKPILDSAGDGNVTDLVCPGENGFVFDPRDAEEIARLVRRFIDEPELLVSMGRRSEAIMRSRTPAAAARRVCEVIELVLSTRRRRP
jgi:glycosyltransferase involved in cell wall biosynthesis